MSDIRIEEMIESQVGLGVMSRITDALIPLLDELLSESGYTGYFGVDIMVYRRGCGELLLCPTEDMNLRMTMGVVAWHLGRDILAPGVDATLRVRYSPSISYTDDYVISGGRMTGGVMSLVPPHQGFKITLSVD